MSDSVASTIVDAFVERLLEVQTGGATEYHQIEQRVAAQTVGTVNRYAGHFTDREQARDDLCRRRRRPG